MTKARIGDTIIVTAQKDTHERRGMTGVVNFTDESGVIVDWTNDSNKYHIVINDEFELLRPALNERTYKDGDRVVYLLNPETGFGSNTRNGRTAVVTKQEAVPKHSVSGVAVVWDDTGGTDVLHFKNLRPLFDISTPAELEGLVRIRESGEAGVIKTREHGLVYVELASGIEPFGEHELEALA